MKTLNLFFLALLYCSKSFAVDSIDIELREKIKLFNIQPLSSIKNKTNNNLYNLGKSLYFEKEISGNRNISCNTCHDINKGTSDLKPLSQTENGRGILKRNSPSLYNLGQPGRDHMFWDGRVYYLSDTKIFFTPEDSLNGPMPKAKHIKTTLNDAISAQALFPMVSSDEMKGQVGDNEIANAPDNLTAWSLIVNRILKLPKYISLIKSAFPKVDFKEINIAHFANAIAEFEKTEFEAINTPFNNYLLGDNKALSSREKNGLKVFLTNGKCIACHRGGSLGGEETVFMNIGVPAWGKISESVDKGRSNFEFKTPALINLKKTAPYTHNGAFETVREVINHYADAQSSLYNFTLSNDRLDQIPDGVKVFNSPLVLDEIYRSVPMVISQNISITEAEKDDLELFLLKSLTEN